MGKGKQILLLLRRTSFGLDKCGMNGNCPDDTMRNKNPSMNKIQIDISAAQMEDHMNLGIRVEMWRLSKMNYPILFWGYKAMIPGSCLMCNRNTAFVQIKKNKQTYLLNVNEYYKLKIYLLTSKKTVTTALDVVMFIERLFSFAYYD